jgi:hypothetical protein
MSIRIPISAIDHYEEGWDISIPPMAQWSIVAKAVMPDGSAIEGVEIEFFKIQVTEDQDMFFGSKEVRDEVPVGPILKVRPTGEFYAVFHLEGRLLEVDEQMYTIKITEPNEEGSDEPE